MAVPLHELGRDLDRNELINVASALIAMPTFDKGERTAIGHAQEFLDDEMSNWVLLQAVSG